MEHWQIVGDYGDGCHAGPKAQRDVTAILEKEGFSPFVVKRFDRKGWLGVVFNRLSWLLQCRRLRRALPSDCVLFVQFPSAAWSKSSWLRVITPEVKKRKRFKLITLFHDLSSLRWGAVPFEERQLSAEERELMALSDVMIVHNDSMKASLVKHGIPEQKMVTLGVFDYLTTCEMRQNRQFEKTVVIAGNLNPDKAGYLDGLAQIRGVDWNLYGVQFDPSRLKGENVHFKGCFSPEDLPCKLEGSFGLVWDGPSAETCTGDLGNYLRINNPHKLSLYLASGLPVIIWSGAAEAQFVKEHGVGLCVDSLYDLLKVLHALTKDDYDAFQKNAQAIHAGILRGDYLKGAMAACLKLVYSRVG